MDGINILMLGGKRCGKTTVLASMYNEIGKALAGTGIDLRVGDDITESQLREAINSIRYKLNVFDKPLSRTEVDENPTSAQRSCSFNLRLSPNGKVIPFMIHDIPGEWLADENENQEKVRGLIHNSQVIIIAIDTPYLFAKMMSDKGYGIYHEEYNKPLEIANFFKNSLSVGDIANRLILFVPIKCERYYHLTYTPQLNAFKRDYMQEIVEAVGDGYRDLMHYLKSTAELVLSCTVAITPILSAGGIDFVKFSKDEETGKVISLYQQAEFLEKYDLGYKPKFCEQPMIYSLVYIITQALRQQQHPQGSYLRNMFGQNPNELQMARANLIKKMRKGTPLYSEDGFIVIQDYNNILG